MLFWFCCKSIQLSSIQFNSIQFNSISYLSQLGFWGIGQFRVLLAVCGAGSAGEENGPSFGGRCECCSELQGRGVGPRWTCDGIRKQRVSAKVARAGPERAAQMRDCKQQGCACGEYRDTAPRRRAQAPRELRQRAVRT